MSDQQQPKIIVDSDWKSQAQAEKARLAAESEKKKPAPGGGGGGASGATGSAGAAEGGAGAEEEGPADFRTLVASLATQALMYLGAFPDPQSGRAMVSLEYAAMHIDLLHVLEDKTKGNLTAEESAELTGVLQELRLRYVEVSRAVDRAMAAELASKGGAPGVTIPGAAPGSPMIDPSAGATRRRGP